VGHGLAVTADRADLRQTWLTYAPAPVDLTASRSVELFRLQFEPIGARQDHSSTTRFAIR